MPIHAVTESANREQAIALASSNPRHSMTRHHLASCSVLSTSTFILPGNKILGLEPTFLVSTRGLFFFFFFVLEQNSFSQNSLSTK